MTQKVFIPLWLLAAAFNLWFGVSPIFLLVFAVPAAVALLLVWAFSR